VILGCHVNYFILLRPVHLVQSVEPVSRVQDVDQCGYVPHELLLLISIHPLL